MLLGFSLQIVVLLVGTNNTSHSAEEVAEGIFEIVKIMREKLPDAYIVLPVMKINWLVLVKLETFASIDINSIFHLDSPTSRSAAQ